MTFFQEKLFVMEILGNFFVTYKKNMEDCTKVVSSKLRKTHIFKIKPKTNIKIFDDGYLMCKKIAMKSESSKFFRNLLRLDCAWVIS